jgi:hypothetical protein
MTRHHNRRGGSTAKRQENVSILSFSAICIALSGIKSVAKRCDAHNEN